MKRKSPFISKKTYEELSSSPAKVVDYVMRNPTGHVPNVLISYQTEDRQHHVTVVFEVISTSRVGEVIRLYEKLKTMLGQEVDITVTEQDAPFRSHIYPDAVIKMVQFPNHEKWSALHQALYGYSWKPHVTFKDGKVKDIGLLRLEMWFGYMRQDATLSNGESIVNLIGPRESENSI